ncbi:MAG: alcohol dehydrogenase catalytic domain-containing protein [Candidatus Electrothrix sp. GW3-4]|uniref:zinc-dependent alcohol dehydrogenase n=1 Tax=Candidatus Electrothrix sp. GW3-4 TaxID=3126740 RepID=UPI0030D4978B
METEVVVVHAERAPMVGVADPGPHQLYKNPQIAVETRTLQELDPDKIRVQMLYAGICGTDVHVVESIPETGYIRSSAPAEIPAEGRVIGHEGVGRILETGAHVRHLHVGAIVTFESIIVCHYCDVCRKGQFNQCRNAKLLGLEEDGIFGETVDIVAMLAHDVTDLVKSDQDLQSIACVEPAGVAYVACQNTHIKGGDAVVIFGAGPIGLFAAMFSKLIFGASSVHIVEPIPFRRQFAGKWSDYVYSPEEFFAAPPPGVDVVIEASGFLENVNKVFRQVNANGRIAFLARSGMPLTLDAMDHMITNAVQLIGSRGHLCGAFSDILRLYREGKVPLHEVVTTVLDGPRELADFMQNPDKIFRENCKVLVRLG